MNEQEALVAYQWRGKPNITDRKLFQHYPLHCTSLYAFQVPQEHIDKSLLWTEMLDLATVVQKVKSFKYNHAAVIKMYM